MFNPGAGFHEKWTKLISWNFVGAGFHEKWTKLISRNFAGARFYDKYCISNKERCPIAAATGACRRGCILKVTIRCACVNPRISFAGANSARFNFTSFGICVVGLCAQEKKKERIWPM